MNLIHPDSGYRPDIDGLRAVAVLGVVLFHAGYGSLGMQILALVAFSSNIQFWRETDYFAEASEVSNSSNL